MCETTKRRQVWRFFRKIKAFGNLFFKGVIGVKTGEIILSRKVHASDLKSDCNMYKKQEKEFNRKPGLCYVIADRSLLLLGL